MYGYWEHTAHYPYLFPSPLTLSFWLKDTCDRLTLTKLGMLVSAGTAPFLIDLVRKQERKKKDGKENRNKERHHGCDLYLHILWVWVCVSVWKACQIITDHAEVYVGKPKDIHLTSSCLASPQNRRRMTWWPGPSSLLAGWCCASAHQRNEWVGLCFHLRRGAREFSVMQDLQMYRKEETKQDERKCTYYKKSINQ